MNPIRGPPGEFDKKRSRNRRRARDQHDEPGRAVASIGEGKGEAAIAAALGHGEVAREKLATATTRALTLQTGPDRRNCRIVRLVRRGCHSWAVAPADPQT